MPDEQRPPQLPQFDEDMRTGNAPLRDYAILLGFVAIAIFVALFFMRNTLGGPCGGLCSDAASSVSYAPGP
jgi:hypothetical protein